MTATQIEADVMHRRHAMIGHRQIFYFQMMSGHRDRFLRFGECEHVVDFRGTPERLRDRIAAFWRQVDLNRGLSLSLPLGVDQKVDPFPREYQLHVTRDAVLRRFAFPNRFAEMRNFKRERKGRRGENKVNVRFGCRCPR